MQSQSTQAFNAQFTGYEGTVKGSKVRDLLKLINTSNAVNSEQRVTAWSLLYNRNGQIIYFHDYTEGASNQYIMNHYSDSQEYEVSFGYYNGYISNVSIKEIVNIY